ncbi:MAG TPA: sigma-70 family RNA polymerase sigma factor [Actinomycetota bacterium]
MLERVSSYATSRVLVSMDADANVLPIEVIQVDPVQDSFEVFYLEHQRELSAAMWLITRDRHETEEITQEAFLRVLERWDRVHGLDDPVGYLFRTASNVWRSKRRRASVAMRRGLRIDHRDDEIGRAETRVDLLQALGRLSPRQRAAVIFTDLVGMSSDETAKALGIRPSTVRVHVARARALLREGVPTR